MGLDCRNREVYIVLGYRVVLQKLLIVCSPRRWSCVDFSFTALQQVQLVLLNAPPSFLQGVFASLALLCTCALVLICMLASLQHHPNPRTHVTAHCRERCIDSHVFIQLSRGQWAKCWILGCVSWCQRGSWRDYSFLMIIVCHISYITAVIQHIISAKLHIFTLKECRGG